MGKALEKNGFQLAGGAKILAVHSMMWTRKKPEGQGHPDTHDDDMMRNFTRDIFTQLTSGEIKKIPLEVLDYNPEHHTAAVKKKLGQSWLIIPKSVDEDLCTQCGVCLEECPVNAITLPDYPQFNKTCFDCFNCIRLCPEDAIVPAVSLDQIHTNILKRVETFNETPRSLVFLP